MKTTTVKQYMKEHSVRLTFFLVIILFISNILSALISEFSNIIILQPEHLNEPEDWYRLITYSFNWSSSWLYQVIIILITGFVIEHLLKKKTIISIILLSVITGGFIYLLLAQNNEMNIAITGPRMIVIGYSVTAIFIGIRNWKTILVFEKIVVISCFIFAFPFWNLTNINFFDTQIDYSIAQIAVILIIIIFNLFRNRNIELKGNK